MYVNFPYFLFDSLAGLINYSGFHLTISLAREAGDLLMTQYFLLRYTILSSIRKGSVKLYFSGMIAP